MIRSDVIFLKFGHMDWLFKGFNLIHPSLDYLYTTISVKRFLFALCSLSSDWHQALVKHSQVLAVNRLTRSNKQTESAWQKWWCNSKCKIQDQTSWYNSVHENDCHYQSQWFWKWFISSPSQFPYKFPAAQQSIIIYWYWKFALLTSYGWQSDKTGDEYI